MSVPTVFYKSDRPRKRRFNIYLDAAQSISGLTPGFAPAGNGTAQDFSFTWAITIPKGLRRARLYLNHIHLDVQNNGGNGNSGYHISCDGLSVVDSFSSATGTGRHLTSITVFGSNHIQWERGNDRYLEVTDVPGTFQFTIRMIQTEDDVVELNHACFELALVEDDYE